MIINRINVFNSISILNHPLGMIRPDETLGPYGTTTRLTPAYSALDLSLNLFDLTLG